MGADVKAEDNLAKEDSMRDEVGMARVEGAGVGSGLLRKGGQVSRGYKVEEVSRAWMLWPGRVPSGKATRSHSPLQRPPKWGMVGSGGQEEGHPQKVAVRELSGQLGWF